MLQPMATAVATGTAAGLVGCNDRVVCSSNCRKMASVSSSGEQINDTAQGNVPCSELGLPLPFLVSPASPGQAFEGGEQPEFAPVMIPAGSSGLSPAT